MVIKNIGKSACHTFEMRTNAKLLYGFNEEENGNSMERINGYKLSIVPSGLEYVVPLFYINNYKEDKNLEKPSKISVDFSFIYNSNIERFSIEYDLSHLNTPFSIKEEKIKQDLKDINTTLKTIKEALKNLKCK